MSITGKLEKTDDGAFAGWIASLTFDVDVSLTPNGHKARDAHPDFVITAQSPRRRAIRVGSGWERTSQAGNAYLSLAINLGAATVRANAIKRDDSETWGPDDRTTPLTSPGALRRSGQLPCSTAASAPGGSPDTGYFQCRGSTLRGKFCGTACSHSSRFTGLRKLLVLPGAQELDVLDERDTDGRAGGLYSVVRSHGSTDASDLRKS